MIKKTQIDNLPDHFHCIAAITKPQIKLLIKTGVIQMELFDEKVCEVEEDGIRYVLRRNPIRAGEMAQTRLSKLQCIEKFLQQKNEYLGKHSGPCAGGNVVIYDYPASTPGMGEI